MKFLLCTSALMFLVGLYGITTSKSLIRVLMCLEILFNAVNLNLLTFSTFLDSQEIKGQVFSLFVLTIAAAESAIALAILLLLSRQQNSVNIKNWSRLKW